MTSTEPTVKMRHECEANVLPEYVPAYLDEGWKLAEPTTKIPDLSLVATIDRAELVAIVESLGLDPDEVAGISIASDDIVLKTRRGYRVIRVVGEWEIDDVEFETGEPCS